MQCKKKIWKFPILFVEIYTNYYIIKKGKEIKFKYFKYYKYLNI